MDTESVTVTLLERAWIEFHIQNPKVYELFKRFALEAIKAGRKRIGARLIGERIRWETQVVTVGDEFKVNDHHWPYYARLFVEDFPDYEDFFEFRSRGHVAKRELADTIG